MISSPREWVCTQYQRLRDKSTACCYFRACDLPIINANGNRFEMAVKKSKCVQVN